jgi:hypothetical protein
MTDAIDDRPKDGIRARATEFADRAREFTVATEHDYKTGIEAMQRIKRAQKEWSDLQRPAIRAAKIAHEESLRVFSTVNDQFQSAYDQIKTTCERWIDDRRAAHLSYLADQREESKATPERAEAMLGPAFDAAVTQGDVAKAARILDHASLPPDLQPLAPSPVAPPPPPPVPKVAGASVTVPYTFDIINEQQIPDEYKMVDRKKIAAVVKAMKDKTNIPGIRVRPDTSLRVRT